MSLTPAWPIAGAPTTGTPPTDNLIEQVNFYVERLIFQYATKPNAQRLIALLGKVALMDDLTTQLLDAFNLDTAVGPQLDVLGKYIGVSRNVGTPILPGLFSLWTYASALNPALYKGTWNPATNIPNLPSAGGGNTGWWYVASVAGTSTTPLAATFKCGDIVKSNGSVWSLDTADCGNGLTTYSYLTVNANGIFYGYAYASQQINSLSDASYRVLLKLKSITNINDGTLYSISLLLASLFPGQITITDNQNMTLTYSVISTLPLPISVLSMFLPKPMGVGISVVIVTPTPTPATDIETEVGVVITTEGVSPLVTEG